MTCSLPQKRKNKKKVNKWARMKRSIGPTISPSISGLGSIYWILGLHISPSFIGFEEKIKPNDNSPGPRKQPDSTLFYSTQTHLELYRILKFLFKLEFNFRLKRDIIYNNSNKVKKIIYFDLISSTNHRVSINEA